jgi:hypothetical protein
MVMDNTWLNSDGLFVKFGKTEGVSRIQGGMVCSYGPIQDYWWDLEITQLDQNENIQNDVLVIPANSLILNCRTITVTAGATGTAIDVGLIANTRVTTTDLNGSITDADPDGILAAAPIANFNTVGEDSIYKIAATIPTGLTGTGALIGTILTVPTLLTASRTDGTAFTAGRLLLGIQVVPMALTGFSQTHVG